MGIAGIIQDIYRRILFFNDTLEYRKPFILIHCNCGCETTARYGLIKGQWTSIGVE